MKKKQISNKRNTKERQLEMDIDSEIDLAKEFDFFHTCSWLFG